MTTIVFTTNLDEPKSYVQNLNDPFRSNKEGTWKGPIPPLGSQIEFKDPFQFYLEVYSLTFNSDGTECHVYLGLPKGQFSSIQHFMDWWKRRKDIEHCKNVVNSFSTLQDYSKYVKGTLGYDPVWLVEVWRRKGDARLV